MSFLNNIFGSSNNKTNVDLSLVVTDCHSHLIPGIDDGSKSIEESLILIQYFSELGYKKLITTPHVQTDFFKNTPETINNGLSELQKAVKDANIPIQIEAAGEYMIDYGFEDKLNNKELLTFSDGYLLIELSYFAPPDNLNALIFELNVEKYKIILAHPERYAYWHDNFKKFEDLKDRDVKFQMNVISLSGRYDNNVKKMAEKMIDAEMIDFIGSDMHNESYMTYFKNSLSNKHLEKLINSGKLQNSSL
jgi:tyrosine-protein phosphatase YwqE